MKTNFLNAAGTERTLSTAFVTVLALTIFRWVTLVESHISLQFDEAQYWDWSRHLAFGYVSKPPLIAWTIWASTKLFGDGEAAIRITAPLLHALTAAAIYALAGRLYNGLTAFWAALVYITLPAVAYSSLIISTDALLLPLWAVALWCWWRLLHKPSFGVALLLGAAIGCGLLAKYAMVYFVICAAVHLLASRSARQAAPWKLYALALAVAAAIIAPNLWWNFSHGWATFSHTADNADWQGTRQGGIVSALTFIVGQAGMFGPIMPGLIVWFMIHNAKRRERDPRSVFLFCFSIPVLAIVVTQALIAGAHINWGAPAYIALTILMTDWCIQKAPKLFLTSIFLHVVILVLLCFSFAGYIKPHAVSPRWDPIIHKMDILAKLRSWDRVAANVDSQMQAHPGYNLLLDERKYAVLFNYYLRDRPYKILIWPFQGKYHSQFAMTNSIDRATGEKDILVSRWDEPNIEHNFAHSEKIGSISVIPTPLEIRHFNIFRCEDLQVVP